MTNNSVIYFCFLKHFQPLFVSCQGTLFNWTLYLHGTKEDPLAQNPHVPVPVFPQPTAQTTSKATTTDLTPKSTSKTL